MIPQIYFMELSEKKLSIRGQTHNHFEKKTLIFYYKEAKKKSMRASLLKIWQQLVKFNLFPVSAFKTMLSSMN